MDEKTRPEPPPGSNSENQPKARPVVDSARMADLAASLGDGLRDVIDTYLEDTPRLIAEIRAAGQRADLENTQRLAHSLKSSSGIFGAQAMVERSWAIERGADRGQAADEEDVQALDAAFQNVRTVLNSYLTNP